MKIFISHAVVDREIASELVDFIESGIGAPSGEIFFSSEPGSIEVGHNFVDDILVHLHDAKLVVALFSHGYLKSQFCMAELGAAKMAVAFSDPEHNRRLHSVLIPPLTFNEIGGMLVGVQSGMITANATLLDLRKAVREAVRCNDVPDNKWFTRQDNFINAANEHIRNNQLGDSISLEAVEYVHREDLTHKYKIMFYFRNNSSEDLAAGPCEWAGKVRLHERISPLKMMSKLGDSWSTEAAKVRVPPKAQFRAWISLDATVDIKYLFGQAALRDVGEIKVHLEKGGAHAERTFKI
jgi:TIR domain